MTRLEQLQKFFEEDPRDPFNIYALALELSKSDKQQAAALFELALSKHPSYLATYYHAAKLYESLNNSEQAVHIYKRGIEEARNQHESKVLRELQSAMDELLYE